MGISSAKVFSSSPKISRWPSDTCWFMENIVSIHILHYTRAIYIYYAEPYLSDFPQPWRTVLQDNCSFFFEHEPLPPPPPLPGQHSLEATCFWRKHERMRLCFLQNNTWSLQISFWIQLIACYFLYILAWEGFSYQRWYILFHEDAPGRDNVGGLSAYWTNSCLVLSITASVQWAQTSLGSWQRFLLLSELHKSTENSEDQ